MSDTTSARRARLSPDERREQLLDHGVRLLASRSIDELSIDLLADEAGVSRGLLYHYFGDKRAFHRAVVRRAADDLVAQTAPPPSGEPLERLLASMAAYVDYVVANYEGYVSLVKGAASGDESLRLIYEEARAALADRIFAEDAQGEVVADTPPHRLVVRGWTALVEELTLSWAVDPHGISRADLLDVIAGSLPALVELSTRQLS
ncbi:MAG: TetR/AcrR family transcriptional regulator [Nocardioides sp.]